MAAISSTFVDLSITVCGVTREVEARVEYIHTRAYGPIVERGSGIPISPPEPENAEIQRVIIKCVDGIFGNGEGSQDIAPLLTAAQIDAIATQILED